EQQPSEVPPSDTPGGSRARRTPSPTPTDSSLPSSSAHRSLSSQDLSAGGEELRSMTASMEQLAMVDPPPVQRRVARAASPSAPLAKTQRSSSGRRRAPANYAAAAAERRSPPPANPTRGSMRGRAKATARPGPSTSRSGPSQPPARGAASSRASRGRGRSAARTSAGSLPQVDTSQLPEETPKGFSHYLIHRHPWARFVNPRPIRMVRDNPPQVHNNLNTEGYRHLPDCGYMSLRFNKSLFPRVVFNEKKPPTSVPFLELQHLEDTVAFRSRSERVLEEVLGRTYVDVDVADVQPTSPSGHPL
ncbi:hypothetical protein OSTOST_14314, partial [Ostertagia ostertagi]